MNKNIEVIVADDHPIFREGLVKIIEKEKNIKISCSCGDGLQAMEYIRTKKPDIAILDISMPGLSGLDITKKINSEKLKTKPVILTMYNDEEYLEEALENEVHGYLLKDSTSFEIIECLKVIQNGGFFISRELTDSLVKSRKTSGDKEELKKKIAKLTPTEMQVIKLISQNKTSHQIADEMFISYRTVQNHRINITAKLGLSGYNALLLFTIENKSILEK